MTLSPMDGCLRCPNCNALPKATADAPEMPVILFCELHGHMASGATLKQAIGHWNHYIQALMTKFPDCLKKPLRSKKEKAISNAAFGIDPTEGK